MPDHRALVTAPFRGPGLERLRELADVVLEPWITPDKLTILGEEQLVEKVTELGADIIICEADPCKGAVLDLDLVAIGSTRGDPTNVDVEGATAKGIPVLHAPGRNADAVAEMAVGLMFAAIRGIVPSDRDVRAGEMFKDGLIPYQRFRGFELKGRTAGLVGLGAIGQAVKWRLEGLGMNVVAYDPYNDDATHSLDELLEQADVVSMHAPVVEATHGMIGKDQFALMKPGSVFINSARADLHDMDALVGAIESGHLGAAALDHFPGEYLAPDHPITAFDNVVLTPHIGGATTDTEANHSTLIVEDLVRLLAGERPERIANPSVLAGA